MAKTETKKAATETIKKKVSLKKLCKQLDAAFSAFIRKRDKRCFSCGKKLPFKKLQCGHYYSRTVFVLRWDEQNSHAQCLPCNVFKHGNYPAYTLALIRKYGIDILFGLEKKSAQEIELSREFYEEMILRYQTK